MSGPHAAPASIETPRSWWIATAVLVILTFSYGAPMVVAVALKEIAADVGSSRALPALSGSLVWMGSGLGAIGYGWVAERIGFRITAAFGALVIGAGLVVSAMGGAWQLLAGHALLVGVIGSGAVNIPLTVYVSRWFDRRRGSALAYITSGSFVAGAIWPSIIALGVERWGWRSTMMTLGAATTAVILLVALVCITPAPEDTKSSSDAGTGRPRRTHVLGLPNNVSFALLCLGGFLCCVPMAMPSGHIVALCTDLGISAQRGALMLSVLLGSALVSRAFWGLLSDRIGGLWTILGGSICQAIAIALFSVARDEIQLFAVSAWFGLGYSAIIPAYVVACRELFADDEASWRVPVWFFSNLCGMALGGWLAGHLYDTYLSYGPAFETGLAFNLANVALIGWMAWRQRLDDPRLPALATGRLGK